MRGSMTHHWWTPLAAKIYKYYDKSRYSVQT
jgi:hypothetical protein